MWSTSTASDANEGEPVNGFSMPSTGMLAAYVVGPVSTLTIPKRPGGVVSGYVIEDQLRAVPVGRLTPQGYATRIHVKISKNPTRLSANNEFRIIPVQSS